MSDPCSIGGLMSVIVAPMVIPLGGVPLHAVLGAPKLAARFPALIHELLTPLLRRIVEVFILLCLDEVDHALNHH